jgi:hypothetical protein
VAIDVAKQQRDRKGKRRGSYGGASNVGNGKGESAGQATAGMATENRQGKQQRIEKVSAQ